jgi:hypothetical protein
MAPMGIACRRRSLTETARTTRMRVSAVVAVAAGRLRVNQDRQYRHLKLAALRSYRVPAYAEWQNAPTASLREQVR